MSPSLRDWSAVGGGSTVARSHRRGESALDDQTTSPAPDEVADAASLDQLALGSGFEASERDRIVARLEKLNRRLKRFPADGTWLEISVKERDNSGQSVTLICELPGFGKFVATSSEAALRDALMDVREDLWRQIDDAVTRRTEGAR